MPYVSFSDIQKKGSTTSFDFIVVGAGSAGCPLASRLSEDKSISVLLIEAGPRHHSLENTINAAIPAGCSKIQHTAMDWEFYTEPLNPNACNRMNTYQGCPEYRKNRAFWPRGKGMGGSSLLNYMAWVRGHPNDYNLWESKHGAIGWGWKTSIGPLFDERIEDISECDSSRLGGRTIAVKKKGPLGISHKTPVSPLVEAFFSACTEVGFEHYGDYNYGGKASATQTSMVGLHQTTVRQGTRCTSARAYIDPLMDTTSKRRSNLTVLTGAKCEQVVTTKKDGKVVVTGVKLIPGGGDGASTPITITCHKEVILSAGALGSPQILLQSGIGPNGTTLELKHVGQNLMDHMVLNFQFQPKLPNQDIGTINPYKVESLQYIFGHLYRMLFQHKGLLCSPTYDASLFYSSAHHHHDSQKEQNGGAAAVPSLAELMSLRTNIQISCMSGTVPKQLMVDNIGWDFGAHDLDPALFNGRAEGVIFCCTLLNPKSIGHLELNDNPGENNGLAIHANYLSDPADVKELAGSIRTLIQIVSAGPYKDMLKNVPYLPKDLCRKYNLPTHDDDTPIAAEDYPEEFLEELIRRHATTLYHPTTTCRMGRSKEEAVVDHTLKVFDVQGLRVADASIQPEVVSGNTQASCVVIGEKAADIIREEYSLKSNPQELLDAVEEYEGAVQRRRWVVLVGGLTLVTAGLIGASIVLRRSRK